MRSLSKAFFGSTLLTLFMLGLCSPSVLAQKITFSGRVIEDHTEEPLPFANVYLKGTTIGVTTDLDGYYTLETEKKGDTIVASVVGYENIEKPITQAPQQTVNFRMGRQDVVMDVFVVEAGENPAHKIIRDIIKRKPNHNIKKQESYQFEVYNKLELDMTDISDEFMNRKVFKPFKFIFENIDSVSEEKPYLPMFITETISEFYYTQNPEKEKEVIKASKISGVKNESVTQFLGNMYQDIDIYENQMTVLTKNFISPISDNGLFYYEYYLVDSATIDNKWCYNIKFKGKRIQENVFRGDMWVADTSFSIRRISMQLDAKDVNVNFVKKVSVFQEFKVQSDSIWALTKDKLIIDFISTKDSPGMIGRKTTTYKDFVFNNSEIKNVVADKEELVVEDGVFDKGEDFWLTARHEELSENEKAIYAIVDTIKKVPVVKTYVDIVNLLVSGYKEIGNLNVEIGPYFNLVSKNAVEDWRFRIGLKTNSGFNKRIRLKGYVAYGTKDKAFKYGATAKFLLDRKPWQTLEVNYQDDLDIESNSEEEFGEDNILAGLYRRAVPQKLMRVRNMSVNYGRDWGTQGLSTKLGIARKRYDPYFDFYYFGENGSDDPQTVINTSEVRFNARFAYKEKFVSGKFNRVSLGTTSPILSFTYTAGLKNILQSDFNYHKIEFSMQDWYKIGPLGWTSVILKGGKIFGELPFILLDIAPGNETFFFNTYAFNRMDQYEFISDTYASLFLTHHFEGLIMNKLPLIRRLKLRSVISAKIAVGTLSDENIKANTDPTGALSNFNTLFNEFDLDAWELKAPDPINAKPYVEVGAGIENILKLFRVDAIWRLTYTDTPSKVGIRAGMHVKF